MSMQLQELLGVGAVFSCVLSFLCPVDILRLYSSSKRLLSLVADQLRSGYNGFHPGPLRTPAEARSLLWLCDIAGRCHPAILQLPDISYDLAEKLVARGFRVSYRQISQAAEARVPGVEVWIRALRGFIMDCPLPVNLMASALFTPAEALTDFNQHLPKLSPAALIPLVRLAVNANKPEAAVKTLQYLDQLTDTVAKPGAGHRQEAEQQVGQQDVALLLQQSQSCADKSSTQHGQLTPTLCERQHTGLTPQLLSELLVTAAQRPQHESVHVIGISEYRGQITGYVYSQPGRFFAFLCSVCAATGVSNSAIPEALLAAASCGYHTAVSELCSLPQAATAVDSQQLSLIIQQLMQHRPQHILRWLLNLPAAKQLTAAALTRHLLTALEHNNDNAFEQLCKQISRKVALPSLQLSEVEQLVTAAVEEQKPKCLGLLLLHMPYALLRRLDSEQAAGWLLIALQLQKNQLHGTNTRSSDGARGVLVKLLCLLPGAHRMSPETVGALLAMAAEQHHSAAVEALRALSGPLGGTHLDVEQQQWREHVRSAACVVLWCTA